LPFKKTFIGHDVWIGENALIKDGVRIGTGAVVGAGAIATKDVPEYAIVVGAPAKIVRFRFDEATRQKIMKTQWWDKSARWLEENFDLFQSPEIFLTKQ
jgi:acetyltransferase-like isoleucine patch superfamily enzyme